MVQRTYMPSFRVETPQRAYDAIVERGALSRVAEFLPGGAGMVFVVTTADVFKLHGTRVLHIMGPASPPEHPYTSAAHVVDGRLDYSGDQHQLPLP